MKKLFIAVLLLFPTLAFAQTFDTNLSYGSTGPDVTSLQEFLTAQHVYAGPISGNFFSLTLAAVKRFQAAESISPVSGFVGSITRGTINAILSQQTPVSEGNASTSTLPVDLSQGTSAPVYTPPQVKYVPAPVVAPVSPLQPSVVQPPVVQTPPVTTAVKVSQNTQPCSNVLCENFDSYALGAVIGQGGWLNRANGLPYIVENTVVQSGSEALYNNNDDGDSVITKNTGAALPDGQQSFYIRTQNNASWGKYNLGENVQMGVFQGSWDGRSRATLAFMKDGHAAYLDVVQNKYVNFDTYTDNSWNLVTIQWRASDASARYQINNGAWTDWMPFTGGSYFTGFDTIGFVTFQLGAGGVYIDSLQ